ncbi:IS66 family transposase [Bradyrhizobium zhanjiangense]|uniref:IS66 family transposase n=1 Tax=Bradyrhizobium zhanjiangense TaxID=1325107 RepID=UPI0026D52AA4
MPSAARADKRMPGLWLQKQWLEATLDHLASDRAKALRYALRHWDGLTLYLDDGRIEMDTNAVERAMRPIKLNAKSPFLPVATRAPRVGHYYLR